MTQTTSNEQEEVFTEKFNQLVMVIDNNLPAFSEVLDTLSKNELKRAFLTVVEHPWRQSREIVGQKELLAVKLGKNIVESTAHALQEYTVNNPEIVKELEEDLKKEVVNE